MSIQCTLPEASEEEEQTAWVSWGSARSDQFRIVNGTRQGSVLSPGFFGVYVDELLEELRKAGVGCYIGGRYFGAAGYADDIILMAPCTSAMLGWSRSARSLGRGIISSFQLMSILPSLRPNASTCVGHWS